MKGNKRPDISFIIPFYASHDFLSECIDSIVKNTTISYEILLIDDANEQYDFSRYTAIANLRLFSMSHNVGPGGCRNVGVKYARGRYIQFIDSDDYILHDPAAYLRQLRHIGVRNTDIITGTLAGKKPDWVLGTVFPFQTNLQKTLAVIKMASFTCHLYRTDFLRGQSIGFPEDALTAEDTVFLMYAFSRARSIIVTDVSLYNYRPVTGSLSRKNVTWDGFQMRFGTAGQHILKALKPYPDARAVKCSVIFKYGIKQLQKLFPDLPKDARAIALRILKCLANEADLLSQKAVTARKSASVYWDDKYDKCVHYLLADDIDAFYAFLGTQLFRVHKGERLAK